MRISGLLFDSFTFLLPPAIICTIALYYYPALVDCSFPDARPPIASCPIPGQQTAEVPAEIAPFRLLALGDPQLEGDSSLPDPNAPVFPSLERAWSAVRSGDSDSLSSDLSAAVKDVFREDLVEVFQGLRKRIDLWGNDLYLAHIYRLVSWWAQPTHTVVLGDLIGSQWVDDGEFEHRSQRFWNTVFKGGEKVPRAVTGVSGRVEVLGHDETWKRRVMALAGNHDIGYAGDIDEHRIERFEDAFGAVNWEIRFRLDNTTSPARSYGLDSSPLISNSPELRLIMLNSMNLDSPAKTSELQDQSRDFLSNALHSTTSTTTNKQATVLLTHIPFHKEEGVCVDGPLFEFFPEGGIKEQNHLTEQTSGYILSGLAGDEKLGKAIVLNGHDHEGCDTYHYRSLASSEPESGPDDPSWKTKRYHGARAEISNESMIGVREITVRSMMGSFSGNAGLLSGWFDHDAQEWKFEYNSCMLGVQHIWWAVHVLDLIVLVLGFGSLFTAIWDDMKRRTQEIVEIEGPKMKML